MITQVAGKALALMYRLYMHSEIIHKLVNVAKCSIMYFANYCGSGGGMAASRKNAGVIFFIVKKNVAKNLKTNLIEL